MTGTALGEMSMAVEAIVSSGSGPVLIVLITIAAMVVDFLYFMREE